MSAHQERKSGGAEGFLHLTKKGTRTLLPGVHFDKLNRLGERMGERMGETGLNLLPIV